MAQAFRHLPKSFHVIRHSSDISMNLRSRSNRSVPLPHVAVPAIASGEDRRRLRCAASPEHVSSVRMSYRFARRKSTIAGCWLLVAGCWTRTRSRIMVICAVRTGIRKVGFRSRQNQRRVATGRVSDHANSADIGIRRKPWNCENCIERGLCLSGTVNQNLGLGRRPGIA